MCIDSMQVARLTGSAKGAQGWFPLEQARIVYDHPFHAQMEQSLIIDFANPRWGPGARLSVKLSAESARSLVGVIEAALPPAPRATAQIDAD